MCDNTPSTPSPRGMKRAREDTPDKDSGVVPPRSKQMAIVLTGGPCSGKSSILALIRDRLSKRGMQVCTVPEYATHFFANSDGFQGYWVGTDKEEGLQNVFLRFQMMQEDMFRDFAALNVKQSVLLCDRGAMDQKVFTSSEEIWQASLKRNNVTERDLLDRYNLVIHLGTCAKVGDYEWGPGSNNPGRYHNPEEAAGLDKTCEEVYHNHKQLRMVPHCGKFEDKVEQVMKYLEDALAVDGLSGKRQRVAVKVENMPAQVLSSAQAFVVTSVFLDDSMERSVRRRVRVPVEQWRDGLKSREAVAAHTPNSSDQFDKVFESRRAIPEEDFLARRVIDAAAFRNAAELARKAPVNKHVLSFQDHAGSHFELLYFQGNGGGMILDHTVGAALPDWLTPEADAAPHPMRPFPPLRTLSGRVLERHSTAEAAHP